MSDMAAAATPVGNGHRKRKVMKDKVANKTSGNTVDGKKKSKLALLEESQCSGNLSEALRLLASSSSWKLNTTSRLRRFERVFAWGIQQVGQNESITAAFERHRNNRDVWLPLENAIDTAVRAQFEGDNSPAWEASLVGIIRAFASTCSSDDNLLSGDHLTDVLQDAAFLGHALMLEFGSDEAASWRFLVSVFAHLRVASSSEETRLLLRELASEELSQVEALGWVAETCGEVAAKWGERCFLQVIDGRDQRSEARSAVLDICLTLGLAGVSAVALALLKLGFSHMRELDEEGKGSDADDVDSERLNHNLTSALQSISAKEIYHTCTDIALRSGAQEKFAQLAASHGKRVKSRATRKATRPQLAMSKLKLKLKSTNPDMRVESRANASHNMVVRQPTSKSARQPITAAQGRFKLYTSRQQVLTARPPSSTTAGCSETYSREWKSLHKAPKVYKEIEQPHNWLQVWDESNNAFYYLFVDRATWEWEPPMHGFITINGALRLSRGNNSFETAH